jgi:hypothetical protein
MKSTIFRKPTATDIIIPNDSCHPPEYKLAAIRCLISHMLIYPINDFGKTKEIVTQILCNNSKQRDSKTKE